MNAAGHCTSTLRAPDERLHPNDPLISAKAVVDEMWLDCPPRRHHDEAASSRRAVLVHLGRRSKRPSASAHWPPARRFWLSAPAAVCGHFCLVDDQRRDIGKRSRIDRVKALDLVGVHAEVKNSVECGLSLRGDSPMARPLWASASKSELLQ